MTSEDLENCTQFKQTTFIILLWCFYFLFSEAWQLQSLFNFTG